MRFLQIKDYDASIRKEHLDAITREDKGVLHMAEDVAINEMRSYLSDRYDVEKCFAPASDNADPRDPLLVMFAKDITLYHLLSSVQPMKVQGANNLRVERYERALKWLAEVSAGRIDTQLPTRTDKDMMKPVYVQSNTKRENHF